MSMAAGEYHPQRILVIRLSALGDVLLATPAVRALKKRFMQAQIDWLVEKPCLPLIRANPYVNPVIYDKHAAHAGASGWWALRRKLASRDYDLVVDLQGKPKTWLMRGLGRRAVAMRKRGVAQALLALAGHDAPLVRAHAVDLFLEVLAPLGVNPDGRQLDLLLADADREEAQSIMPAGRVAAVAVSARWATKRWPPEKFAALIDSLARQGLVPMLLGGPQDGAQLQAVRAHLKSGPVADTMNLSVGGLAGVIAQSELVVAGDSGPVHMASALGRPVVAIFGPTSPERWQPLSARSEVISLKLPCSPCSNHGTANCPQKHYRCMTELQVDQVMAAVARIHH